MKTPTDILRDEHVVILRALAVLESATARLTRGAALPDGWWAELIEWLRAFADRNHHAKEERALFPAMARAGVPAGSGGPIGVMLEEHVEGRALVQAMAAGGPGERAVAARKYIELLRNHIDKENGVLFPLADAVLEDDARRALGRDFEAVGDELGRGASIPYAEAVVDGLAAALAGAAEARASR